MAGEESDQKTLADKVLFAKLAPQYNSIMDQLDILTFSHQHTASDLFLQTLLHAESFNDDSVSLEIAPKTYIMLLRGESTPAAKLPQQGMKFGRVIEQEDPFFNFGDNCIDGMHGSNQHNEQQSTVTQQQLPQKTVWKCCYPAETRKMKIERYINKKQKRIWHKKVAYDSKKQLANRRQRVNGRFAKREQIAASVVQNSKQLHGEQQMTVAIQESSTDKIDSVGQLEV